MVEPQPTIEKSGRPWLELIALLIVATVVRLPALDRTPQYDEFYHIHAASSWVDHGGYEIGDGLYDRGRVFTVLVGMSTRLFGDGLIQLRLPAMIAGVLWAGAVFWWLRRRNGAIAGWTAGLLMAFAPSLLFISQFCRFYTLHSLCIWLLAIVLYGVVEREITRRWTVPAIALGAAALALAMHLQETTLIAIAALGAWTAAAIGARIVSSLRARPALLVGAMIALLLLVGAAVAVLLGTGRLSGLLANYRWAPEWAAPARNNVRFYFDLFTDRYATLWALFPAALVLAYIADARRAIFCAIVFGICFVAHSFAGAKNLRYIAYALPFFFAIWGLGCSVLLVWFHQRVIATLSTVRLPITDSLLRPCAVAVVAACVLFAAFTNGAFVLSQRIVLGSPLDYYASHESDWAPEAERLRSIAETSDVVIVTSGPKALYYLGDYDYELNTAEHIIAMAHPRGGPIDDPPGAAHDPRLGHPVIRDVETVRALLDRHEHGLLVADEIHWQHDWGVDPAVIELIESRTEAVETAPRSLLRVFRW